eukprot:5273994-Alexandrium_andersonii.AAC.1
MMSHLATLSAAVRGSQPEDPGLQGISRSWRAPPALAVARPPETVRTAQCAEGHHWDHARAPPEGHRRPGVGRGPVLAAQGTGQAAAP